MNVGQKVGGRTITKIEVVNRKKYIYLSGGRGLGIDIPITDGKTIYMIGGHAFTNTPPSSYENPLDESVLPLAVAFAGLVTIGVSVYLTTKDKTGNLGMKSELPGR